MAPISAPSFGEMLCPNSGPSRLTQSKWKLEAPNSAEILATSDVLCGCKTRQGTQFSGAPPSEPAAALKWVLIGGLYCRFEVPWHPGTDAESRG